MNNLSSWRRVLLSSSFLFAATALHAANVNARIKGSVTDPGGAQVARAQVTATNQETGVRFTTTSQANGDYIFQQLPIGTYTITVSVSGFKTFTARGIELNIDQDYVEPVKLAVGSNAETISVDADPVQVNTTDMQFSNIVNSKQMVELPLIGRSFTGLELTLPGVQLTDTRFAGNYSVNGGQGQQSEYLINGADTTDLALNTIVFTPNLDAIAQFNLIDGPLNAEYDRNSAGIVSATIKQGSNHFHGDAFEFYRDTFLNTQNFLQKVFDKNTGKLTSKTSPYHEHIFGGTLGGPILRDKLFFFGAYEGRRRGAPQNAAGSGSVTVYSPAMLGGDFSADPAGTGPSGKIVNFSAKPIPASITIPGCAPGTTWAACLGPLGGKLPASVLNSTSVALATKYLPPINSGTYGSKFNETTKTTQDQYIGRIDFDPNSRNQITVLGIYEPLISTNTLPFSGASVPGFGDGNIEHIQQWTFDYVRQISSTAVNDFALHYTRLNFDAGGPQQVVQPSSAGFQITPEDPGNATIPTINVAGYFNLGGTSAGPQPRIDQTIQASDTFSKTVGRHNLKFGYDGRRFNVTNNVDAANSGTFNFRAGGKYSTGDAGLDFLLGIPDSFSQGTGADIQTDAYLHYFFAQDSWKAASNFTVDFGLGYSIDTPLRNHQYGGLAISCFIVGQQSKIFPNAPKNMNFPGDPGCSNSAQATTHYFEFGPRLGFAWAPDLGVISGAPGRMSIRGGFGIYYNRTENETAVQTQGTPPFGFTSSGATEFGGSPQFINPYADINNGQTSGPGGTAGAASEPNRFPYLFPTPGTTPKFPGVVDNISTYDATFRAPYSENFQLSIEREFPSRIVARLSYVGSLGRREQTTPEANYETPAGHAACLASTACQAASTTQGQSYPGNTIGGNAAIPSVGLVGSEGASSYHSLQASLIKGATHGLLFQMSYTYGHALDNSSSYENSGFGGYGQPNVARGYNQYVPQLNYGDSTYDTRHHFVFSPIYTTPMFKGKGTFSPLNLALAGWQISGILQLATGQPYDIAYYFGTSNALYCSIGLSFYNCPDVPNQIAPLVKLNPRKRDPGTGNSPYFSASSFAGEAVGSFGNVHRNPYHGPGSNNTNLIIARNFNLSADGSRSFQIRMESDNVFNHTQFSLPNTTYGLTTFGFISSAAAGRQTQLGGKLYF